MGKVKDAFTFWGTAGEYAEEQRLDRREWAQNVWKIPNQKQPKPHTGYISLFDLSVLMGNQDYWQIAFFDIDANTITCEQAQKIVMSGQPAVLKRQQEWFLLTSFDGQYFQTQEMARNL